MRIDVVTLFPELVEHASRFGVTGRALERGLWQLATWNPRDFTTDNYRTVDDRPYGGGPGMVMLAEPLSRAVSAARAAQREAGYPATRTIHLSPSGVPLTHGIAAARKVVNGASVGSVGNLLGAELGIAAAYFTVGVLLLRVFERQARTSGSFERF